MATNEAVNPNSKILTIIPSGIKRHQEDFNCADSGCEEIINMRYKHGVWRNVGNKVPLWEYDHHCAHLYYHPEVNENTGTDYFVGYDSVAHKIYLIKPTDRSRVEIKALSLSPFETFMNFSSLNNILVVTTNLNVYYFTWSEDTSEYLELSKDILPNVEFFYEHIDNYTIEYILDKDYIVSEMFSMLESVILPKVAEKKQEGYLSECFVALQWAFKMWDGSYILHSQPSILKCAQTGETGYQTNQYLSYVYLGSEQTSVAVMNQFSYGKPYFYLKLSDTQKNNLKNYRGLIKSLCVFMSNDVSRFIYPKDTSDYTLLAYNTVGSTHDDGAYALVGNDESILNLIQQNPLYLAKEIKLEDLYDIEDNDKQYININEALNFINSDGSSTAEGGYKILESQPILPQDEFTHHELISNTRGYIYNAKRHIGNLLVKFFGGYDYSAWQPDRLDALNWVPATNDNWTWYREVKIKTDKGIRWVVETFTPSLFAYAGTNPDKNGYYLISFPPVISYPDARAERIRIICKEVGDANYYEVASFNLESHKIYNYAFKILNIEYDEFTALEGYNFYTDDLARLIKFSYLNQEIPGMSPNAFFVCGTGGIDELQTDNRYYEDRNRVQVSKIDNALVYPSKYSYQIGNSYTEIKAFGAQSMPVSPGQFGQFPLSVFTSQGIWLMQQGSGEVIYSAIVPLNHEIAYKESICELGGAIVYASPEGVKILSGNQVQHISRDVEGEPSIKIKDDSYYINFITDMNGNRVYLYPYLSKENFLNYLDENVRICWDNVHKELIITNRDLFTNPSRESALGYTYIYNMEAGVWSKITDTWHQFVFVNGKWYGLKNYRTSFPTGLSADDMTEEDDDYVDTMIQSRPMKWGSFDLKKMIKVVQRSECHVGHYDPDDSDQSDDKKFGLYLFAALESQLWKFIKGIEVSQSHGLVQNPSLGSPHASMRYFVLLTAVKSNDFIFSHWEVNAKPGDLIGQIGREAKKTVEYISGGEYDSADYDDSYNT